MNLTEVFKDRNLYQMPENARQFQLRWPHFLTVSLIASVAGAFTGVSLIVGAEEAVHVVDLAYHGAVLSLSNVNLGPAYSPHLVTPENIVVPVLITVGASAAVGLIRDLRS